MVNFHSYVSLPKGNHPDVGSLPDDMENMFLEFQFQRRILEATYTTWFGDLNESQTCEKSSKCGKPDVHKERIRYHIGSF